MAAGTFDIAVIGSGVNGCGIARDAAGRRARVLSIEAADLARGTSSASSKLSHGGLRYLEHLGFALVRESLSERERLWAIAPHIVRPMQTERKWCRVVDDLLWRRSKSEPHLSAAKTPKLVEFMNERACA